jgi:hypothetical protein
MPLGGIFAEAVGMLIGEILWQGLFKHVVWPVLRFPGTLLAWCIRHDRPFRVAWEKGDKFAQTMAGIALHTILILAIVAWA